MIYQYLIILYYIYLYFIVACYPPAVFSLADFPLPENQETVKMQFAGKKRNCDLGNRPHPPSQAHVGDMWGNDPCLRILEPAEKKNPHAATRGAW